MVQYMDIIILTYLCNTYIIKNSRGWCIDDPIWVFGLVDALTTLAIGYMEIVQSKDRAITHRIIQHHTVANTVVHTDK